MPFVIDMKLLLLKCLYFFQIPIYGCLYIYLNPFMSEFGLSASEIAIINFNSNIFAFIIRPIIGFIADKYQKYKGIILFNKSVCILVLIVKLIIPKNLNNSFINNSGQLECFSANSKNSCTSSLMVKCSPNFTDIEFYLSNVKETFLICPTLLRSQAIDQIKANKPRITYLCDKLSRNCTFGEMSNLEDESHYSGLSWSLTFWLMLIMKTTLFLLFSTACSLTDTIAFIILGENKSHRFGLTRMFGSIGVLLFSIITGILLHFFELFYRDYHWKWAIFLMSFSRYIPSFAFTILLFSISILIASFITVNKQSVRSQNFLKSLGLIFRNAELSVFLIFATINGGLFATFIDYYFLIIQKLFPGLPGYFSGLLLSVMTLSDIIFIGISSVILKYRSDDFWISLGFLFGAIRYFFYFFVNNYWILPFIDLFNGPSFGMMLTCMMSHVSKFATQGTQGRLQNLFGGLFFNIGGALGALYGGFILDKYGHNVLYISISVISFLCFILYYPLQRLVVRKYCQVENGQKRESENQNSLLIETVS